MQLIKQLQVLKGFTPILREATVAKCYQTSLRATEKSFMRELSNAADFIILLQEIATAISTISNHCIRRQPLSRQDPLPEKRLGYTEGSGDG